MGPLPSNNSGIPQVDLPQLSLGAIHVFQHLVAQFAFFALLDLMSLSPSILFATSNLHKLHFPGWLGPNWALSLYPRAIIASTNTFVSLFVLFRDCSQEFLWNVWVRSCHVSVCISICVAYKISSVEHSLFSFLSFWFVLWREPNEDFSCDSCICL